MIPNNTSAITFSTDEVVHSGLSCKVAATSATSDESRLFFRSSTQMGSVTEVYYRVYLRIMALPLAGAVPHGDAPVECCDPSDRFGRAG
jgi:hypothetical protein